MAIEDPRGSVVFKCGISIATAPSDREGGEEITDEKCGTDPDQRRSSLIPFPETQSLLGFTSTTRRRFLRRSLRSWSGYAPVSPIRCPDPSGDAFVNTIALFLPTRLECVVHGPPTSPRPRLG